MEENQISAITPLVSVVTNSDDRRGGTESANNVQMEVESRFTSFACNQRPCCSKSSSGQDFKESLTRNPQTQFDRQFASDQLINTVKFSEAECHLIENEKREVSTSADECRVARVTCPLRDQITRQDNEIVSVLPTFCCTSKLLTCTAKIFGLWKPLGRFVFCLGFFVLPLIVLATGGKIVIVFACEPSSQSLVNSSFCGTIRRLDIEYLYLDIEKFQFLRFASMVAQLISYVLIVYCIHRKRKGKTRPLDLPTARVLVTRSRWARINFQLTGFFIILIAARLISCGFCDASELIWNLIVSVVLWLECVCCLVFTVVLYALEEVVNLFYDEITGCQSETLGFNDIIEKHQRLCSKISTSTHAYNKWLLFNTACYFWVIIYLITLVITSRNQLDHWQDYFRICTDFLYFSFVLFYPWVTVARLSRKLRAVIGEINATVNWGPGHVFSDRSRLNDFLLYTSHAHCEVTKLTLGSSLPWLSLFLGFIGLGVRLYS